MMKLTVAFHNFSHAPKNINTPFSKRRFAESQQVVEATTAVL
jgi:hypothetical protein